MEFVAIIIIVLILGTYCYAGLSAAPWLPMRSKDIERVVACAAPQPGERFYDLGCGDGRVVRAFASRGAHSTGFEISLLPYFFAKIASFIGRQGTIRYKSLWSASIGDADIVFLFLFPDMYSRLIEKLKKELRPGARIVVYVWMLPDLEPTITDKPTGRHGVYVYTV